MSTRIILGILLIVIGGLFILSFDHIIYMKDGKVFDFRNIPLPAILGAAAIVAGIVFFFWKPKN